MGLVVGLIVALVAGLAVYFLFIRQGDREPPTAAQVTAAFVPLEGFEYVEMPTESLEPLRQAFAAQGEEEAVAHFDARQVQVGGKPTAVVFILSVDPDEMKGDFQEQYITGFTSTSQATVEDFAVNDTSGHISVTPLGTVAFFFDPDGFAFNVVGQERATVEVIARGLEEGNS
jgi:hypothetical protein